MVLQGTSLPAVCPDTTCTRASMVAQGVAAQIGNPAAQVCDHLMQVHVWQLVGQVGHIQAGCSVSTCHLVLTDEIADPDAQSSVSAPVPLRRWRSTSIRRRCNRRWMGQPAAA